MGRLPVADRERPENLNRAHSAGVRAAAVWALGQIADPAARDAVLAAKNDADSGVRDAANVASRHL